MTSYFLRKLLVFPLLLLLVSWLVFLMPQLLGVDTTRSLVQARIGERSLSEGQLERLRLELALDRPIYERYLDWLKQVLRGDLGDSLVSRTAVSVLLWQGFQVTLVLTSCVIGLSFALALLLASLAARYAGRFPDTLITTLSQFGIAFPEYALAPLFILFFALELGWLPSAGWRGVEHIVLPVLTLLLRPLAYFVSQLRASLVDVLAMDYICAARAKGLPQTSVMFKHALRNALIPVLSLMTYWFAALLGGSVIVEVIFAIPGMGRLIYEAALASDLPLLQASLLLLTALSLLLTTLTDLLYLKINPAITFAN